MTTKTSENVNGNGAGNGVFDAFIAYILIFFSPLFVITNPTVSEINATIIVSAKQNAKRGTSPDAASRLYSFSKQDTAAKQRANDIRQVQC